MYLYIEQSLIFLVHLTQEKMWTALHLYASSCHYTVMDINHSFSCQVFTKYNHSSPVAVITILLN